MPIHVVQIAVIPLLGLYLHLNGCMNAMDIIKRMFYASLLLLLTMSAYACSAKYNPDASYLIENFDRKNTDNITINYDFDYSEYESTDRFYSKEVILADLDPDDQKRIIKQIESILTDEEFEEVPWDETRGGSQYRLLILDAKQVNITVYQKEGYIATKDPESDIAIPLVYKVNNDKLDKLCDLVDEATAEIEPS